ncbi:hypothetical protein N7445_000050 [Penicillium cf. griseofulvum]|nr:hypothetical protein N7445_000050 [Penicillium cf. griseofulvum]
MDSTRYTWDDALGGKEPREYAQNMICLTRSADRTTFYGQLLRVRDNIERSLRSVIMNPTGNATLPEFLGHLDLKFLDWHDQVTQRDERMAAKRRSNPRHQSDASRPGQIMNSS